MEEINRHNYEAYLLDLAEGRLTREQRELLMGFMDAHPELKHKRRIPDGSPSLKPDLSLTLDKDSLLKTEQRFTEISPETEDAAMIAWFEDDLSGSEREALTAYMAGHQESHRKFQLYGKAFLSPPVGVTFPGKKNLLRKETAGIFTLLRIAVPAAAVVALAITVYSLRGRFDEKSGTVTTLSPVTTQSVQKEVSTENHNPGFKDTKPLVVESLPVVQRKQPKHGNFPENRGKKNGDNTRGTPSRLPDKNSFAYIQPVGASALAVNLDTELRKMSLHPHDEQSGYYLSPGEWLAYRVKRDLLKEDNVQPGDPVTSVDIASLGVKGINALTGWNISVEEKTDTTVNRKYVAFTSQLLSYTRIRERK